MRIGLQRVARGHAAPGGPGRPWMRRAGSRAQWLALFWLLGVGVYAGYSWAAASQSAWRRLGRASAWAATLAQRQIERSCQGFDFVDFRLAGAAAESDWRREQLGRLRVLGRITPGLAGLRRVALLDPDGRVVAATGDGWPEGRVDPRTLGLLRAAARGGQAGSGSCRLAWIAGAPPGLTLYAEHGLRGRSAWAVIARIDPREIRRGWSGQRGEAIGGHALHLGLVDARGRLVLGPPGPAAQQAARLRGHAPGGGPAGPGMSGGEAAGAAWTVRQELPGLPFSVYASVQRSAVLEAWWEDNRLVMLGGLGLAGLPGGLGLVGWPASRRRRSGRRHGSRLTRAGPGPASPGSAAVDARADAARSQDMSRIELLLRDGVPGGLPELAQQVSELVAGVLGARVVLVAHVAATATWAGIVACAGPGRAGCRGFRISLRDDLVEGQGPSGTALRTGVLQQWHVDEPRNSDRVGWFHRMGAHGLLALPARTCDAEQLLLVVAYEASRRPPESASDMLRQVVERLARQRERETAAARATRLGHYRHAWMAMQQQLAQAHSRAEVLRIVADSLIAGTDVLAVEMFLPGGGGAMLGLHIPGRADAPAARALALAARRDAAAQLHARAWSSGQVQLVYRPRDDADMPEHWRSGPLARAGVLAALPVAFAGATLGFGVLRLVASDPAPWDEALHDGMRQILQTLAAAVERVRLLEQAQWQGSHDMLTGLHARDALLERLRGELAAACDDGRGLVLCVLDLDGFHRVNARWGQALGDSLLHAFGARLQASIPQALCVARVGADEFALLVESAGTGESMPAIAHRLELALHPSPRAGAADRTRGAGCVGFCIGLTRAPDDDGTAEALLEHAYAALQQAKLQHARGGEAWAAWSAQPRA